MKKAFGITTLALLIIFTGISISTFAQDKEKNQKQPATETKQLQHGPNFVDKDGDGVCDFYKDGRGKRNGKGHGVNYVDSNGDGVCDHYQGGNRAGKGKGTNFVDKDGDGICDNYQSGNRAGKGKGANFVDKDGDGVCDNFKNGNGRRHGNCRGQGRGRMSK